MTSRTKKHEVKIAPVHNWIGYKASGIKLHVFCDTKLFFCHGKKNRLAPMKIVSLQRLELNAAVLSIINQLSRN